MTILASSGEMLPAAAPRLEGSTHASEAVAVDERFFESFYRRSARMLWNRLYRLTGDAAKSDDLLQKAFIQFLRSADASRSEPELRSYLFTIATRLTCDEWRREQRERAPGWFPFGRDRSPAEDVEMRRDVGEVFANLGARERIMLWMAHVDEAPHDEIADAVGVQRASVKVLLFRARKKLAELLRNKGLGPEVMR